MLDGPVLICAFTVPADDEQSFVDSWRSRKRANGYRLHQALLRDAEWPFVGLGHDCPGLPHLSHSGRYEVIRDEGDVDGPGGTVFVNSFEVPEGEDERFLSAWDNAGIPLSRCVGFLGRRMHRAIGPARYRFVNVGRWSSPLMVQRAMEDPDVNEAIEAIDFPSQPGLYRILD